MIPLRVMVMMSINILIVLFVLFLLGTCVYTSFIKEYPEDTLFRIEVSMCTGDKDTLSVQANHDAEIKWRKADSECPVPYLTKGHRARLDHSIIAKNVCDYAIISKTTINVNNKKNN